MPNEQNTDEQNTETVAYHEAGHAIAAALAGGIVVRVSIEPEEDDRGGDTQVQWSHGGVTDKEHAIREIRTSLAGPVAEMIFVGDYDSLRIQAEHAIDWQIAVASVKSLTSDQSQQLQFLSREASELYHYFRQENVWAAIGDLADQLLAHETVDGETVDAVVEQWI